MIEHALWHIARTDFISGLEFPKSQQDCHKPAEARRDLQGLHMHDLLKAWEAFSLVGKWKQDEFLSLSNKYAVGDWKANKTQSYFPPLSFSLSGYLHMSMAAALWRTDVRELQLRLHTGSTKHTLYSVYHHSSYTTKCAYLSKNEKLGCAEESLSPRFDAGESSVSGA